MDRGGTPLLLAVGLIPVVPFSLMGYAAGATRVRVWHFAWTTVVGFLPLTAAVAYLGSRRRHFSRRPGRVGLGVAARCRARARRASPVS